MPYLDCSRAKVWVFPPKLDEVVAPDHEVRFVAEFVEGLDMAKLGLAVAPAAEGRPSYPPRVLLACWVYGFMSRVRSNRKIERACREWAPFMWLSGMTHPDHNTLWRFYQDNRQAIRSVFKESVAVAQRLGLVDMVEHAVDGSKIKARAAVKRSYDKAELEEMARKIDEQIEELEEQNKAEEAEGRSGHLPKALARAEVLKEKVKKARQEMEESGQKGVNLTDGQARFMKVSDGYQLGYNGQAVVEGQNGIVVAQDVVDAVNDVGQLSPMLKQTKENLGENAEQTVADAGYFSGANIAACEKGQIGVVIPEPQSQRGEKGPDWAYHKSQFAYEPQADTYRCPQGKDLLFLGTSTERGQGVRVYRCRECGVCPVRGECTADAGGRMVKQYWYDQAVAAHREKMKGDTARALSKLRKTIVEPVFGIIKEQLDGRRFLLRGLENVRAEWALLCTAHNLRKIVRAVWSGRAQVGLAAVG